MGKKFALIVAVILCCSIVLSGCSDPLASIKDFFNKKSGTVEEQSPQTDENVESMSEVSAVQPENTRPTVMYYKDAENLLVPVMRYVPKGDLGIAKGAISALVYSAEKAEDLKAAGLIPSLPMGTKINGLIIKDSGTAVIDLSKEFLSFSTDKAEQVGVKALVYTLTEFANVKDVQIKIDGKVVQEMPKGTKIGDPMKRSEINLQSAENNGDKLSKVMVYYQKKGSGSYSYFVPVTKLVTGYKNSAEAALNSLLAGPAQDSSLRSAFPEGTKLLGVQVKDGVAYVNFSNEILNTQGSISAERAILKSVTLTLKEFPQISKVKIFVNGKTIENTEGIGADQYLDVPVFVNFYE